MSGVVPVEETDVLTEPEKITNWRLRVLLDAGYPQAKAENLAERWDVDLHHACDLLKAGCPPKLAYDILS